jgi:hypothetical protein
MGLYDSSRVRVQVLKTVSSWRSVVCYVTVKVSEYVATSIFRLNACISQSVDVGLFCESLVVTNQNHIV